MKKTYLFIFALVLTFFSCQKANDDGYIPVDNTKKNAIRDAVIDYLAFMGNNKYTPLNIAFLYFEETPRKIENSNMYYQIMDIKRDAPEALNYQLDSYLQEIRLWYPEIKYATICNFQNGRDIDQVLFTLNADYYVIRGYKIWDNAPIAVE